ncbi:hypothetical protein ES702_04974 [subsurface metagenome]
MQTVKLFDDIELVRIGDIAEALDVNVVTIRRYIRSGKLVARKIGPSYYVSKENFLEFLNNGGAKRKAI